MTDDIYINGKYIFGHNRKSNTEFYSTVSVKELLLKNKDVFAAGIIDHTVSDFAFHNQGTDDLYISASAWCIANVDDINGHYGDCTKACSTCTLCMVESIYTDGLTELVCFDGLLNKLDTNNKNKLAKYDSCILFMTICQFQEEYWKEFSSHYDERFSKKDNNAISNYEKECPTYTKSLEIFLNMTDEEQLEKYNRMKLVREYIENPTKIEGIPWW